MTTSAVVMSELAISTGASVGIATSVDASPLLTALIALGTSIVTMVGGEIVKFLVAFFKKKTNDLKQKDEGEKQDENKK